MERNVVFNVIFASFLLGWCMYGYFNVKRICDMFKLQAWFTLMDYTIPSMKVCSFACICIIILEMTLLYFNKDRKCYTMYGFGFAVFLNLGLCLVYGYGFIYEYFYDPKCQFFITTQTAKAFADYFKCDYEHLISSCNQVVCTYFRSQYKIPGIISLFFSALSLGLVVYKYCEKKEDYDTL